MEKDKLDKIRHTLAHILAWAVQEKDPKVQLAIGPTIEHGFYYDLLLSKPLSADDLPTLEARMRDIVKEGHIMSGREVGYEEAKQLFAGSPFKLELIGELRARGEKITAYTLGAFTDLCRGGHVENTKEIPVDCFKLDKLAGAYWRGSEKNAMLTRIYGLAFASKKELDAHLAMLEEAKKRDHKKLGKELGLFTFSETVGRGLPLWTPKGTTIRRELERFIVDEEIRRGYLHVCTPDIAKVDLYRKSGHYPHYKDSMYTPIVIDDEEFMLRPMSCPHHFELYLSEPHSYRELPMRIAEVVKLYRYEQSGELSGLQRVRAFSLADAHIICANEEQAVSEVGQALDLIEYVTGIFGLQQGEHYWYRLSLGNRSDKEKYYKNDTAWDRGEALLRKHLQDRGCRFVEAPNEAAFYGPKIDIQMKNVNGKEDTAFTVQYDFCMPERFDLAYAAEDGSRKRAMVVHRSSIGAIERIMAFLIEHYAGAFPVWLSPVQIAVLPISEKHGAYARGITAQLKKHGFRVELDASDESLGKKIRNVKMSKTPYWLVLGDKEIEARTVGVESRDHGQLGAQALEQFIAVIALEIKERR